VDVSVRVVGDSDRAWLEPAIRAGWGSDRVVSRGRLTEPVSTLPGFVAELGPEPAGYALIRVEDDELEVAALESLVEGRGIGRALLEAVQAHTGELGLRRAWLIRTNDNLHAAGFYQRCGWEWVALHRDAVIEGRRLKPEIPEIGARGIAIRHELEFEWRPKG